MSRMRLISTAYEEIKRVDPNTALTLNGLRCLVKSGKVLSVKIGRKTLVNLDSLYEYFNYSDISENVLQSEKT